VINYFPYLQTMKKLILPLFLFFVSAVSAQKVIKSEKVTDHSMHIVGDDFEGIIFNDNYFQNPKDTSETKIKRFTPSSEDIFLTESILKEHAGNKQNKGDEECIFSNLKKYRRQYIGYFNDKGEKLIYVNCFPVNEDWAIQKAKEGNKILNIPRWYNSLFHVFDGGNRFWQIKLNLSTKKMFDFWVNGVA